MNIDQIFDEGIRETLSTYGFHSNHAQCEEIRAYISLLLDWNQKVSLTTVINPIEILRFHFGESLFAASSVPIQNGRLADVGSGAGFPSLPLRIGVPELQVSLLESNSKKAAFLAEVVRTLRLKRVEVIRARTEEIKDNAPQFDYITARAVGNHKHILSWSRRHLPPDGKLVLWLGEEAARTIATERSWNWRKPVHIPESARRLILVGSPAH